MIRLFLVVAIAVFSIASSIHAGLVLGGYEHDKASIAEGVIAAVMLFGLVGSWLWPQRTRAIALVAEALALLGALVGVFTIALGVGPRTAPDIVLHAVLIIGLTTALIATWRRQASSE